MDSGADLVQRGRSGGAVEGTVDHLDAVLARRVRTGLEVGLVDLDDVGAGGEHVRDLGPDDAGVGQRDLAIARVVIVLGLFGSTSGSVRANVTAACQSCLWLRMLSSSRGSPSLSPR